MIVVCALRFDAQLDMDTLDIVNTYTYVANLTAANEVNETGVLASVFDLCEEWPRARANPHRTRGVVVVGFARG